MYKGECYIGECIGYLQNKGKYGVKGGKWWDIMGEIGAGSVGNDRAGGRWNERSGSNAHNKKEKYRENISLTGRQV